MKLVVSREAEEELAEAAEWYERKRAGLGVELVMVVDAALESIARDPFTSAPWRSDRTYRMKVLDRFPFLIFFEVEPNRILIHAIAHARRRPGYWQSH